MLNILADVLKFNTISLTYGKSKIHWFLAGWTGNWEICFRQKRQVVRVQSKQENLNFRCRPGPADERTDLDDVSGGGKAHLGPESPRSRNPMSGICLLRSSWRPSRDSGIAELHGMIHATRYQFAPLVRHENHDDFVHRLCVVFFQSGVPKDKENREKKHSNWCQCFPCPADISSNDLLRV